MSLLSKIKKLFSRRTLVNLIKPRVLTAGELFAWVIGIFYLKFLIWDIIWACDTTFSGFQFPLGYLTKLIFSTLLALPLLAFKSRWYVLVMGLIIDAWLVANLMYFRTYFTVIPASSYLLVSNLSDFQDSVWESLRLIDIIFPLTTAWAMFMIHMTPIRQVLNGAVKQLLKTSAWLVGIPLTIVAIHTAFKGGYKKAYEDLMYDYSTCGATVYTIPGAMIYEFFCGHVELTPQLQAKIDTWIASRPETNFTPPDNHPNNLIIILLESFENWPIGKTIEGQEITPNINRLVADSSTFYASHILNQVKGGRSIDAQLIIHTGLLPVKYGAYSYRFVHNTYPSLDRAWKENHGPGARSMSFSVDKRTVWNVAVVAQDFGYELYDKPTWKLDVKTGPRGRLGDDSFLRQAYDKITSEGIIGNGTHSMVQLVTYSGHTPFVIPDQLKKVHFSDAIPERLRHYLEVANYTDRAVGEFVNKIRSNPATASTMIVITGDHEGIGTDRNSFIKNPKVASWLDSGQFVPLIIVNAPVPGHYDKIAGQVDIYPTLLDMLGLKYHWRGLGQSLLDPSKQPYAITTQNQILGDASSLTPDQQRHARDIFNISDLIIASDYFKNRK